MGRFKEDDLVRVIAQPPKQFVQIKGLCGYIEEVSEEGDYYGFQSLEHNGSVGGYGGVPDNCLELCDETWLGRAKEIRYKTLQTNWEACQRRSNRVKEALQKLADKHRISLEEIRAIQLDLKELDSVYF